MKKVLLLTLLACGTTGVALAQHHNNNGNNNNNNGNHAPEIDPSSAVSAVALLSGGVLVIRGRRK